MVVNRKALCTLRASIDKSQTVGFVALELEFGEAIVWSAWKYLSGQVWLSGVTVLQLSPFVTRLQS